MVTERLNNIHILRGLASLAVCWAHMTAFHPISSGKEPIQALGSFGVYGVQIFFIISGYVIPRSLHQIHGRRAGHISHKHFHAASYVFYILVEQPSQKLSQKIKVGSKQIPQKT